MSYLTDPYSSSSSRGEISQFPDPFLDYASLHYPKTQRSAHWFCEYIFYNHGVYAKAVDRVVSFFITELELSGADKSTKDHYLDFLHDDLGILSILRMVALDYVIYGNSVVSVVSPQRRYLGCKNRKCGHEAPLRVVQKNPRYGFQWKGYEFTAKCPYCGYSGAWTHNDRAAQQEKDVVVKRWNIHEIDLLWDPYTEDVSHIWKIPDYYRNYIRRGSPYQLERAPWEVIEAVKHNNHIEFAPDTVFHLKIPSLCGMLNRGWGISPVLSNFRQAWYVQVLHRYNEALALDYVIPFRVLSPAPRPGSAGEMADPLMTMDGAGFMGWANAMLRRRRRDPATWNVSPYPIQYQTMGGEAGKLASHELMNQGIDTLLNSIGVPVEFYKGSLTTQNQPAASRLLESTWSHLIYSLNMLIQWLLNKFSVRFSWDRVTGKLARPSHVDDLNRQLARLQLVSQDQISKTTGLKTVGIDFEEELSRKMEEERLTAEKSKEMQEEMDALSLGDQMAMPQVMGGGPMDPAAMMGGSAPGAVAAGAPPAGGAAPAGGANAAVPVDPVQAILADLPRPEDSLSPPDLQQIAMTKAQQILQLPEGQKDSALRQLKQRNPTIHAIVRSFMEDQRRQWQTQGIAAGQQQAQMAGGASAAPPPPMAA